MVRNRKVFKKTVSIVNEKSTDMYESLVGDKKGFLLESYDKNYDRYTFFGMEPEEIVTSRGNALVITKADGTEEVREGNPLERLKEYYSEFHIEKEDEELSFSGGLVGNLGYDFVRYSEVLPDNNPDEIGIETIQMMLMTSFLMVDHVAETLTAVVLEEPSEEGREQAMEKAGQMIKKAMEKKECKRNFYHDGKIIKKSDSIEEYGEKVEKIKHYIREGHVFQTVLSQRWTIETRQTGFELYKELRELNPSPYLYYFNYGTFEVIGSSPEMIVKKQGNKVFTCPIAGTRKRGKDEAEDKRLRDELLSDEKERAEHVMLVDLARNDMGRIAKYGSVYLEDYMKIHRFSKVMHIASTVCGQIREDKDGCDTVSALLPAGTLSGAPKFRACQIIDELEKEPRGVYGGAIGYIDLSGNLDVCIAIRTAVKKENKVYVQAGAGIVADSIPESEYMECAHKAGAVIDAIKRGSEVNG